jgi:hypothetical protein
MSPKIKLSTVAFVLAASVATSIGAFAEDAPARVRGTLQKLDGNNLTMGSWHFRSRDCEAFYRRTMTPLGLLSRAAQGGTARYAGR